ncbi:hypothetical protein BH23ACT3_BH23ACT3_03470 [soil metagenome]
MPAEICDVDHEVEHQHGGPTSLDNGRIHCPSHNRNPELRHRAPTGPRITRPPRGWIPDTHHRTRHTNDDDDHHHDHHDDHDDHDDHRDDHDDHHHDGHG